MQDVDIGGATQWADTLINAGATLAASVLAVVVAVWLFHAERKAARAERLSDEAASRRQLAELRHKDVMWSLKLQALQGLDRAIEEVRALERAARHNELGRMDLSMSVLTNASALIAQFDATVARSIDQLAEGYPNTHSLQDVWAWASEAEGSLRTLYSSTLFAWYTQEASSAEEPS